MCVIIMRIKINAKLKRKGTTLKMQIIMSLKNMIGKLLQRKE